MLLRTRITVLVSLVFLVTFAALIAAGLQRERLASEPQARIAIGGVDALWREIVAGSAAPLLGLAGEIARDNRVVTALAIGAQAELRPLAVAYATERIARGVLTDLQILDEEGRILFAASAKAEPGRLLDFGTIEMVADGGPLTGLRQADRQAFRVVAARPLRLAPDRTAVIAVAAPIDPALGQIAEALEAQVYLLNTRGRVIDSAGPDDWASLDLVLPQRIATVTQARRDDRLFAVTSVPLADVSAGTAGLLVTVQDATEALSAVQRLTSLTLGGAATALVVILVGLSWYLRAGFRPLDAAVSALGALSRGDTDVRLPGRGEDEIGQIAAAVRNLRHHLVAHNDTRRKRELQRRRQERFVRRQMETLAGALEAGAREEVLSDLRRIVAAGAKPGADVGDAPPDGPETALSRLIREDDQLGPLAAVLQQMSGRVVEQHRRLTELIKRLQEALVRETELASLQQELRIASDLQRSVLPVDFPDRPAFLVHGTMEPAKEVGGDFYDFFDRQDGRFVVVIADVSGKGVPAAFFMAICRTLLKAIALFEPDPATCVRQLNDLLSAGNDQMMFVTLFFAVFDPQTGRLDYVNAGHNPPFLANADGDLRMLEASQDMAVAVMEDMAFSNRSLTLAPGDRLIMYTDGMTEAFAPDGSEFGESRLADAIRDTRGVPGQKVTRDLVEIVHRFEAGGDQSDDMTLLILDRKQPEPSIP